MLKKPFILTFLLLVMTGATFLVSGVQGEKCYIAKNGFGVLQSYMVTKSCFLFRHGANVDLRNQSEMVITRKEELHPDPIHSEFLRYVIDRKLITLKKGTPVFSCGEDIEAVAHDFKFFGNQRGVSRTLGYELPSFNCSGVISRWVPVRPVHESHCYWIAVPLLRCNEFGSDLIPINVDAQVGED